MTPASGLFAWLGALLPLTLVSMAFVGTSDNTFGTIYAVTSIVLLVIDQQILARRGTRVNPFFSVIPPLYLRERARRTRSSWAMFITWISALVMASMAVLVAAGVSG